MLDIPHKLTSSRLQKHIDIANGPVQFQLNSEGQVSLFEMSVELEAVTRAPGGPIHEEVA